MRKTTILALAAIGLLSTAQPMSAMEIMPATLEAGLQRTSLSENDIERIAREYPEAKVIWQGRITGYKDPDKRPVQDDFEGCDWDRLIFLDDRYQVTCKRYHYHYRYRPEAVLLKTDFSYYLYVDDYFYEVRIR